MELSRAEPFLAEHRQGILITQRRNGWAQSSNIVYDWRDGAAHISLTADRAKTKNAMRDPRVSLHVSAKDFWQYVVIEGTAELSPVTTEPGDATGRLLAEYYERVAGEAHPDWDEYFQAMIDEKRQILTLRATHAYGQMA